MVIANSVKTLIPKFIISDISLSDFGRKEIKIAETEMPGLMALRKEYKGKKILFACDTGYGEIYKNLGKKFGPIDLTIINIGAYNFKPMFDKSIYHTNPEEALQIAKDLNSRRVIGMHWGTFVLSLEPIMEPPKRFLENAKKYGFKREEAIIFKIGEFKNLDDIL